MLDALHGAIPRKQLKWQSRTKTHTSCDRPGHTPTLTEYLGKGSSDDKVVKQGKEETYFQPFSGLKGRWTELGEELKQCYNSILEYKEQALQQRYPPTDVGRERAQKHEELLDNLIPPSLFDLVRTGPLQRKLTVVLDESNHHGVKEAMRSRPSRDFMKASWMAQKDIPAYTTRHDTVLDILEWAFKYSGMVGWEREPEYLFAHVGLTHKWRQEQRKERGQLGKHQAKRVLVPDFYTGSAQLGGNANAMESGVLYDLKTQGVTKSHLNRTERTKFTATQLREQAVPREYRTTAKELDEKLWKDSITGQVDAKISNCLTSLGRIQGMVFGPFGEVSQGMEDFIQLMADQLAPSAMSSLGFVTLEAAKGYEVNKLRQKLSIACYKSYAMWIISVVNRRGVHHGQVKQATEYRERDAMISFDRFVGRLDKHPNRCGKAEVAGLRPGPVVDHVSARPAPSQSSAARSPRAAARLDALRSAALRLNRKAVSL